jgi:calcineurin-like phosphoesterase family protein
MIWFTADFHINHANVIRHCDRPFKDVSEMNRTLIDNFNSVVRTDDTTYHLGDFLWKGSWSMALSYFKRLNGHHKILEGNHDKYLRQLRKQDNPFTKVFEPYLTQSVQLIEPLKEINVEGQRIILCHYAMATWPGSYRGSWMLFGHSHGKYMPQYGLTMDVGVDPNHYFPVSFQQVKAHMSTRKQYCPDIKDRELSRRQEKEEML